MSKKIKAIIFTLTVLLILLLCGCGADVPENTVHSIGDMEGKIVGVMASTAAEESVLNSSTAGELKRYYDTEKLADDLKNGVIDCVVVDRETGELIQGRNRKLVMLQQPFSDQGYRIAVPKGNEQLFEMLESTLEDLKTEGVIDDIIKGWMEEGKSVYVPVEPGEEAMKIAVGISPDLEPYAFYANNGQLAGLEIDILTAICDRLGIVADVQPAGKEDIVYMAESGKVSLSIGRLTETDSEAVEYTDTYLTAEQYVLVRE